jgi:hypothetical protein
MGKIKEQARAEKGKRFQPTGHVLRRPTDELSLRIVNQPTVVPKKPTLKPIVTRPPPLKSNFTASTSSSGIVYGSSSSSRDTQDKPPAKALDFFASDGVHTTQRRTVIIRKQVVLVKPPPPPAASTSDNETSVPITPAKRPLPACQVIDVDNHETKTPAIIPPPAPIPRARNSESSGGLFVSRKKSKYR